MKIKTPKLDTPIFEISCQCTLICEFYGYGESINIHYSYRGADVADRHVDHLFVQKTPWPNEFSEPPNKCNETESPIISYNKQ